MDGRDGGRRSGELAVPFVFVPHGEEPPSGWLAEHPGAVRFPGRLVLKGGPGTGRGAPGAIGADDGNYTARLAGATAVERTGQYATQTDLALNAMQLADKLSQRK